MQALARLGIFFLPPLVPCAYACLLCWISLSNNVHCFDVSRRCVQQGGRAPYDAGTPHDAKRYGVGLAPTHAAAPEHSRAVHFSCAAVVRNRATPDNRVAPYNGCAPDHRASPYDSLIVRKVDRALVCNILRRW